MANMQFRLCFVKRIDSDATQDFAQIASANDKPELTISYTSQ